MLRRKFLDQRCETEEFGREGNVTSNSKEPSESDGERGEARVEQCPSESPNGLSVGDRKSLDQQASVIADLLRSDNGDGERAPPYLPQPEDSKLAKNEGPMGPVGPWATGRVSFRPRGGLTGLRPVSDRYSITHHSPGEWRALNDETLRQAEAKVQDALGSSKSAKGNMFRVIKETDQNQQDNTERLNSRARVVSYWKTELERAIVMMIEEIELLETERRRVKQSLSVLTIPESISGEFLQLRSTRLEPDLVRDAVNDELTKEVALCAEVRDLLIRTREQIEAQSIELKTAKNRMEFDWTDKKDAADIEAKCIGLANDSPLIMWRAGAIRVPAEQSTTEGYEHVTREALAEGVTARQRSATLRNTLDSIYVNSIRDLRMQADRVDSALAEKISVTEQCCQRLEKELLRCLYEIANIEETIAELRVSVKNLDSAMKVAQSRLDNRLNRRNVESCRDDPQSGLVEEVKRLSENIDVMNAELKKAEEAQMGLVKSRGDLERQLVIKKKSLYVDRDRGQMIRSFYPSAAALSGHV